jgi:rod shape-determining protein MreD
VRAAGVFLALTGALALQSTLAGASIGGGVLVNLVLVVVVYSALAFGPVAGLLAGSAGGLAQDALAGGVIGIGGFSMTLVGFMVGVLGAQFIVSQPFPRLIMFVGATILHELCFHALYALAEVRAFRFELTSVLTQAALNGLIGILAFQVVETGPGLLQRRRARGATLKSRRF